MCASGGDGGAELPSPGWEVAWVLRLVCRSDMGAAGMAAEEDGGERESEQS